jgi:hypothetical protein
MSEINCHGDEVVYSKVIPGWYLVQLVNLAINRKDLNIVNKDYKFYVNGFVMGEGDFGLTNCNDPDFVFSMPPQLEPEISEFFKKHKVFSYQENLYYKTLDHYHERLCCDVPTGYRFYNNCIEAGYNPKEESLASWLMPKIYESYQKGKLRTWTKTNGLIIYQPDLPKEPHIQLFRLKEYNNLSIEELKYATYPNWLKQALNNTTKEIVYIEYSHWDELTDKHYHAIWSLNYVTWKYELREVGTYEHEYTFSEINV